MRHRKSRLLQCCTLTTTLALLLVFVGYVPCESYKVAYKPLHYKERNGTFQLLSEYSRKNVANNSVNPKHKRSEIYNVQDQNFYDKNRINGTRRDMINRAKLDSNKAKLNQLSDSNTFTIDNGTGTDQNFTYTSQGSSQLQSECAILTQPLQSAVATVIEDDIFTQCTNKCNLANNGDLVLLSIAGPQVTCGCAYINFISQTINLIDKNQCSATCDSNLNLPCGSLTAANVVSMYSLESLSNFLESNLPDDQIQQNKPINNVKKTNNGIGGGAAAGISIGVLLLLALLGFLGWKYIKKDKIKLPFMKPRKDDAFINAYNTARSVSSIHSSNFTNGSRSNSIGQHGPGNSRSDCYISSTSSQLLPNIQVSSDMKYESNADSANTIGKPDNNDNSLFCVVDNIGLFDDSVADTISRDIKNKVTYPSLRASNNENKTGPDNTPKNTANTQAETINRMLQVNMISKPATANKKFKAATVPRKLAGSIISSSSVEVPARNVRTVDRANKTNDNGAKPGVKTNYPLKELQNSNSSNVLIVNDEFVIPTASRNDKHVVNDDFIKTYKQQLISKSQAFENAISCSFDRKDDNTGDELNNTLKITPTKKLQNKFPIDDHAIKSNEIRSITKHDDATNSPINTSSKKANDVKQLNDATDNLGPGDSRFGNKANETKTVAESSNSSDVPIDSPMMHKDPSITFETPTEEFNNKNNVTVLKNAPNAPTEKKKRFSYKPFNKDDEEITRKKDPKRISLSKAEFKLSFKRNAAKNKNKGDQDDNLDDDNKQIRNHDSNLSSLSPESDDYSKRNTYLSRKLKKIQINTDSQIDDSNTKSNLSTINNNAEDNEHSKDRTLSIFNNYEAISGENSSKESSTMFGENIVGGGTNETSEKNIDDTDALADMGIGGNSAIDINDGYDIGQLNDDSSSKNRFSVHNPENYTNDNSAEYESITDKTSNKNKSPDSKTNRWSAALSIISESHSKRSSNIRDSLIKKFKEGVSFNSKSSSNRNSQRTSQNDYFISTSEDDSKK